MRVIVAFRLILSISIIAILVTVPIEAISESAQVKVDWGEKNLDRARSSFDKSTEARTRSSDSGPPLTLPRWGFGADITAASGEEKTRSLAGGPSSDIKWPQCAEKSPKIARLNDETRSWYTDDYDYGCITLSITGDRNFDTQTRVAAAPIDDCKFDQGRSVATSARSVEHPESDTRTSFQLSINLNGVPYSIKGDCLTGAEEFCLDKNRQCALIERLIFMGGREQ